VQAALATLPEHQRTALVLVDMHGMPVAEAAAVLGVASGTVKSRCARGRAALAPLLAVPGSRPASGPPPATDGGDAGNRTVGADVPTPATSRTTIDERRDGRQ
jgi:RNA polymerase sigma-70 factor, ECF subfamily